MREPDLSKKLKFSNNFCQIFPAGPLCPFFLKFKGLMKPGLTCVWQCAPKRNEIGFSDWMKMDLSYIDNWSLWLDLKILFQTVKVVFSGEGR